MLSYTILLLGRLAAICNLENNLVGRGSITKMNVVSSSNMEKKMGGCRRVQFWPWNLFKVNLGQTFAIAPHYCKFSNQYYCIFAIPRIKSKDSHFKVWPWNTIKGEWVQAMRITSLDWKWSNNLFTFILLIISLTVGVLQRCLWATQDSCVPMLMISQLQLSSTC